MENVIILVITAVLFLFALTKAKKRVKGGCCGGGNVVHSHKKLDGPILGKKRMTVEGMHCENCQARVEDALNHLDGVACTVNLKKKTATVSFTRPVTDEELKQAVEDRGYRVTEISEV